MLAFACWILVRISSAHWGYGEWPGVIVQQSNDQRAGMRCDNHPVQPSAAPPDHLAVARRRLGFTCAVFVVCWAVPGAAYCVVTLPSALYGPGVLASWIWWAGVLYAIFWVSLPVILLVVGIGHLRFAVPGWRWPAAWACAVVAGIALDPFGLLALNPFDSHSWYWVALFSGFVALGAAMMGILISAARWGARER